MNEGDEGVVVIDDDNMQVFKSFAGSDRGVLRMWVCGLAYGGRRDK